MLSNELSLHSRLELRTNNLFIFLLSPYLSDFSDHINLAYNFYKVESFCGDAAICILLFFHYLVTVLRFIYNQLLAETWCRSYHSHRIDGLALVILTDPDTGDSIIIIQYFFKNVNTFFNFFNLLSQFLWLYSFYDYNHIQFQL